ncbi:Putative uncharacterized protein [Pararhodospirillum photometricum DSM 122]|uniref:DUF2934 domain-containing protein n=2 Tax=Pararhodospirillum photometricum TaxID=1084 RepID=H6SRY4_PARPM|nr:Putative uncharacterized protein [Pararhodospirillum photometricum DSM 122]
MHRTKRPVSPRERPPMTEELQERIKTRAYYLAEAEGFPSGRDHDFWALAEAQVRAELAGTPAASDAEPPVVEAPVAEVSGNEGPVLDVPGEKLPVAEAPVVEAPVAQASVVEPEAPPVCVRAPAAEPQDNEPPKRKTPRKKARAADAEAPAVTAEDKPAKPKTARGRKTPKAPGADA